MKKKLMIVVVVFVVALLACFDLWIVAGIIAAVAVVASLILNKEKRKWFTKERIITIAVVSIILFTPLEIGVVCLGVALVTIATFKIINLVKRIRLKKS